MQTPPTNCVIKSLNSPNLFAGILQTVLAAQCAISSPDNWPRDYGSTVWNKGCSVYEFN